jgi:nucleoid-associated protein YgaU
VDPAVLKEVLEDLHLGLQEPGKQERQTVAIRRITARPEAHQREGRVERMRVPALAFLLLIAALGGSWAAYMYSAGHQRAADRILLYKRAPQTQATVASMIEKEREADVIQVTVDPEQTLSGISMVALGAFDDQVLRQIKQLNPGLENPDLIVPGQKILLPSRHSLPKP